MTKERYMALDDLQTVWDNNIKPYIEQTYATKGEAEHASVAESTAAANELT